MQTNNAQWKRRQPAAASACALLAALCAVIVPAWSQGPPAGCTVPSDVAANGSGSGFFQSFANSTYETALTPNGGTSFQGDNNSTYFSLSYSLYNLQNYWMNTLGNCPIETSPQCQVYIANWSDTSISVDVSVPVGSTDYYLQQLGLFVSPLSDFSPLTLFLSTQPANTMNCPVKSGDHLTFTVTNPEGGGSFTTPQAINVQ